MNDQHLDPPAAEKPNSGIGPVPARSPQVPDDFSAVFHDQLRVRVAVDRIAAAMLQPLEVARSACHELAPFFADFHFTVAVHYPESRLFAVHTPASEPARWARNETLEGYFLTQQDDDVLALEDYGLWTPPATLELNRWFEKSRHKSGLFAASRIHGNVVLVAGLQDQAPFVWGAGEIETLRTAAQGLGLAYYHALVCDNLVYSCREAAQRLDDSERERQACQRRSEQVQIASEIARGLGGCRSMPELLNELTRQLNVHCPGCRVTLQVYLPRENAFRMLGSRESSGESIRPAAKCIQKLFLNNVPVNHVFCNSFPEIELYRELDPQFVNDCERADYRSFCTVPVYVGDRLWATMTAQSHETGVGSRHADLLTELGRDLALPIQMIQLRESFPATQLLDSPAPPSA